MSNFGANQTPYFPAVYWINCLRALTGRGYPHAACSLKHVTKGLAIKGKNYAALNRDDFRATYMKSTHYYEVREHILGLLSWGFKDHRTHHVLSKELAIVRRRAFLRDFLASRSSP